MTTGVTEDFDGVMGPLVHTAKRLFSFMEGAHDRMAEFAKNHPRVWDGMVRRFEKAMPSPATHAISIRLKAGGCIRHF